jgi:hypothetical protein
MSLLHMVVYDLRVHEALNPMSKLNSQSLMSLCFIVAHELRPHGHSSIRDEFNQSWVCFIIVYDLNKSSVSVWKWL